MFKCIDDADIKLENLFYEAEDLQRTDPEKAVRLFQQVIDLEVSLASQLDPKEKVNRWQFKSLVAITRLLLTNDGTDLKLDLSSKLGTTAKETVFC